VVSAFETMKERVQQNQRALVATEQMAVIGRLTADIVHELNSPLSAIVMSAAAMKETIQDYETFTRDPAAPLLDGQRLVREVLECADISEMAATRATEFVRSIRSQSRAVRDGQVERFDAVPVIRDAIQIVRCAARAARCEVSLVTDEKPAELEGVPSALAQAVTNLLQNAIDAMREQGGGQLTIRVETDAGGTRIHVQDTGPGIRPDVLPRIFEPLYTTKPYGKGTGLGLPIVKEAIEKGFAGRIAVDTRTGQGTTFTLSLPRRRPT
jgi:signal transduction histidine kinase